MVQMQLKFHILNYSSGCADMEDNQTMMAKKGNRKQKSAEFKIRHNHSQKLYYDSRKDDPQ